MGLDHQDIRDTVQALCATFPPEYHREIDEKRGYPEEFVNALTKAGWRAAMIPEEYGGSGLGAPGFGDACPPSGEVHRYQFKVHALGVETLGLDENASPALVGFMTGANTIATAELTAVYTR
ncbi:MAG: acyl-CoA dehydrogenase family protein [Sulfitobacter sp.]